MDKRRVDPVKVRKPTLRERKGKEGVERGGKEGVEREGRGT